MQKIITLREADMLDFYAFTLFYSKKARTQYAFNVFGVFGEAMIAGFVLDMFLKTQIFTILGVAFSVFGDKAYHFCGIRVFGNYEMNFIVYENYENIF